LRSEIVTRDRPGFIGVHQYVCAAWLALRYEFGTDITIEVSGQVIRVLTPKMPTIDAALPYIRRSEEARWYS
jgi:hypothetical protein